MSLTQTQWEQFSAEARRLGLTMILTSPLAPLAATLGDPLFSAVADGSVPPGTTHVAVLLQTGGAYWAQLRSLMKLDAELRDHADPLDTMTRRLSTRLAGLLGDSALGAAFPFDAALNFVALGQRMGAGVTSRLSILIHPEFGPWMAFRTLFYIRDAAGILPATAPQTVNPCDDCAAPCIAACPAGAFLGASPAQKLDYPSSFTFRRKHREICVDACAARLACPVGAAHRYPADFIAHSHHRAFAVGMQYLATGGKPKPAQGRLF